MWLWLRHCWAAPWNGHWRSCSCRGKGAGNNSYPKPLVYTIQIHLNHSSIEQTHSLRQHTSCLSRIRRILSLNVIHFSCPAVPAPSVLHFLDTGVQKETQHTHTHTHPQTNTQFQFDSERRQMWPWQASWPSWERRGAAPRKGSFDGAMAHHGAMVTCTVCSDLLWQYMLRWGVVCGWAGSCYLFLSLHSALQFLPISTSLSDLFCFCFFFHLTFHHVVLGLLRAASTGLYFAPILFLKPWESLA